MIFRGPAGRASDFQRERRTGTCHRGGERPLRLTGARRAGQLAPEQSRTEPGQLFLPLKWVSSMRSVLPCSSKPGCPGRSLSSQYPVMTMPCHPVFLDALLDPQFLVAPNSMSRCPRHVHFVVLIRNKALDVDEIQIWHQALVAYRPGRSAHGHDQQPTLLLVGSSC